MFKNLKLKIICFLFITYFLSLISSGAYALTMSNSNYILQMGNFNMASGKPTGDNYKLGFTAGQTAPGLFTGTNYKVRSGFQYIKSIISFAFSVSSTSIDFGVLPPTEPVTRTNNLTISNGSANGYAVTASENHQLLVAASGALIPDTTCDNGTCTQSSSSDWTNTLTYGFGYRCDNITGTDCASGFATSALYKQFADNSLGETAQNVMNGANVGRNKQATITYKVNISNTQAAGLYTNVITYIATPTF